MSTDLVEPGTATDVILLPVNEQKIAELSTAYLALRTNGPDDRDSFEACHKAEQVCVKLRTGTVKAVKELTEPLKKQIEKYKSDGDKLIGLLAPIEAHLKNQKRLVTEEIARREQEAADELYDLRKRRWLEATGNPPDFDGVFPEAFLRSASESDCEAEIQRLTIKTAKEREETIKRIEAEAAETKRRNDEAARIAEENRKLAADRERLEQERRQLAADKALLEQQQRERQAEIDRETQRLLSQNRAREEADKPVAGGTTTSPADAGDAPAAAPSVEPVADNADYDRGWIDGARHIAGFTKMLPTSIEAMVNNRKQSQGYKPQASF